MIFHTTFISRNQINIKQFAEYPKGSELVFIIFSKKDGCELRFLMVSIYTFNDLLLNRHTFIQENFKKLP